MIGASEALRHYRKIHDIEKVVFEGMHDDLLEQASGLITTSYTLDQIKIGRYDRPSKMWPRLSQVVFNRVFEDTLQSNNVPSERALALVSDFVIPLAGARIGGTPQQGTLSRERVSGCPQAEPRFRDCLRQITAGEPASPAQPSISIYHNAEGLPVVLQKSVNNSALTLEPLRLTDSEPQAAYSARGEVQAPAGTIGRVGVVTSLELTGQTTVADTAYSTYLIDGQLSFWPHRLSAWAYDDSLDRSIFALHAYNGQDFHYDSARAQVVEDHSLSDFRKAAGQVMALCGVEG
jgi:hypothetical protein